MKKRGIAIIVALPLLAGCGGKYDAAINAAVPIAQTAALQVPAIAKGCEEWRRARANPLIQGALTVASTAASVAGYGVAASGLDWVRAAGDRFCTEGPPAGDVTSTAERASWLADLVAKLR